MQGCKTQHNAQRHLTCTANTLFVSFYCSSSGNRGSSVRVTVTRLASDTSGWSTHVVRHNRSLCCRLCTAVLKIQDRTITDRQRTNWNTSDVTAPPPVCEAGNKWRNTLSRSSRWCQQSPGWTAKHYQSRLTNIEVTNLQQDAVGTCCRTQCFTLSAYVQLLRIILYYILLLHRCLTICDPELAPVNVLANSSRIAAITRVVCCSPGEISPRGDVFAGRRLSIVTKSPGAILT